MVLLCFAADSARYYSVWRKKKKALKVQFERFKTQASKRVTQCIERSYLRQFSGFRVGFFWPGNELRPFSSVASAVRNLYRQRSRFVRVLYVVAQGAQTLLRKGYEIKSQLFESSTFPLHPVSTLDKCVSELNVKIANRPFNSSIHFYLSEFSFFFLQSSCSVEKKRLSL